MLVAGHSIADCYYLSRAYHSIKQSRLLLRLALYLCMYLSCFIPNLIQTYYDLHSARLSFVAGWLPPQTKERGYTVVESQGFGGAYNFLVQISLGDDFNEEQKPMWLLPTFQVCGGWRNIIQPEMLCICKVCLYLYIHFLDHIPTNTHYFSAVLIGLIIKGPPSQGHHHFSLWRSYRICNHGWST